MWFWIGLGIGIIVGAFALTVFLLIEESRSEMK